MSSDVAAVPPDARLQAALAYAQGEHERLLGGGGSAWRFCDDAPGAAAHCALLVSPLPSGLTRADVCSIFAQAGPVLRVSIGRKGGVKFAHVEMATSDGAFLALNALSAVNVAGASLRVTRTNPGLLSTGRPSAPVARLYVANLDGRVSPEDVSSLFRPFGPVSVVALSPSVNGLRTAYVEYVHPESAVRALDALRTHAVLVSGRRVLVGRPYVGGPLPKPSGSLEVRNEEGPNADDNVAGRESASAAEEASGISTSGERKESGSHTGHNSDNASLEGYTVHVVLANVLTPDMDQEEKKEVLSEVLDECATIVNSSVGAQLDGLAVVVGVPSQEAARKLVAALNGRWFDGRRVAAAVRGNV